MRTLCESCEQIALRLLYIKERVKNLVLKLKYEKISDKNQRQKTINKLKEKIQKEINQYKEDEQLIINYFILNNLDITNKAYEHAIFTLSRLFLIEEYINSESSFMEYRAIYEEDDIIIYDFHINTINLFLQSEFDFTWKVLERLGKWCRADNLLWDRCLANSGIVSIIDELEYERKIEIKNGDNS